MNYYTLCEVESFYKFDIKIFLDFLILLSDKFKDSNIQTLDKINFQESLFWGGALSSNYKDGVLDKSILKCFGKKYSKELIDRFIVWHSKRSLKLKELNVKDFSNTKLSKL